MAARRRTSGAAQEELERLYLQPPERFVRTRDELARSLRERGERDAAGEVKKLRRPSQAAWLVNQLALRDPGPVEDLLQAGDRLRRLEDEMLAGRAEPDDLRAAAAEEREAIARLVETARGIAGGEGTKLGAATLDRVGETLQAASAEPELAERVRAGRLDKEARSATVGVSTRAPSRRAAKGGRRGDASRAERDVARAELERARADLERAEQRRERAESEVERQSARLKQARDELAAAKREVRSLAAEVRRAERTPKRKR